MSPTALMLLYVNYFMYVHRFCLETYLLLDGLPSRDDQSQSGQENMEVCIIFSFFSNNFSIWLTHLLICVWQLSHKLKSRKWHWHLVPLPGLTSWHLAPSYHEVTVTESESLSTEQLFLERKCCENSIFTGEVIWGMPMKISKLC